MGDGPRLGVFGGTFDPAHLGHLAVARPVAASRRLERVLWVPAAVPPHKQGRCFASADARRRMVEAAVADHVKSELCDLELVRGGVSYTVDTLRALKAAHREWRLLLIVGDDLLGDFPSWRAPEEVLEMAELVVATRDGLASAPAMVRAGRTEFRPRTVAVTRVDVSSSGVRERVRQGKADSGMVTAQVSSIIDRLELYREPRSAQGGLWKRVRAGNGSPGRGRATWH